ncbi:hypothetical protein HMPREF3189_01308 [Clostridiales bacterium KA00134]|nr:hypothetical protein HMPREF3189_01308 [Clostridiales bacterium KA00134]
MLEKNNPKRAVFEIQKSDPLTDNLLEFADVYNRSIEELNKVFNEVDLNEVDLFSLPSGFI